MQNKAKILIIIVTWNKKDYVIDLLNSVANINYPRQNLDILVIDNASNDGTVEALKTQFPEVQLICNSENIGGTGGFNTGLAWAFQQDETRYDYLWLLDNDVQVHQETLSELVAVLDKNTDVAICGSTMMQLDYPWRINEMGAFVDPNNCVLQLNRHHQKIEGWREKDITELLVSDVDLSKRLMHCQASMDVDYVAAASLLIRASVAKEAGLWMDFFIHFDDVEWCLRIAKMGHRVQVSARSLIWHVSAISKVPTWILYYDNRNIMYLLQKHSQYGDAVKNAMRLTLKKALYYHLIGKQDISALHITAVEDFRQGVMGKKDIKLTDAALPIAELKQQFLNPEIKNVLLPWTVNLQATEFQALLVEAMQQRKDLRVFCLLPPASVEDKTYFQVPGMITLASPKFVLSRYYRYFRMRHDFDLVVQSDYQTIVPLSWLAKKIIFVNYENFTVRKKPVLTDIFKVVATLYKHWILCK